MDLKGLAKKIVKHAPLLGSVLGGPVGSAVGGVVSAVASAFGVDPDEAKDDPQVLMKAIEADPQAAIKLKEIESNLKLELQKLAVQQDQARLADIANARSREVEITKATGKRDINLYVLAWIVVIGFFTLCGLLMKIEIPSGSNQVVFLLFGALATGFGQVLQYFFGSSKSSADKTEIMAQLTKK